MSDSNSGGGGGCILVPIGALGFVIFVILWAGYDWDAKEAAWTGLWGGVGVVCGLPLLFIIGLFGLAALLYAISSVSYAWNRKKRWKDVLDDEFDEWRH